MADKKRFPGHPAVSFYWSVIRSMGSSVMTVAESTGQAVALLGTVAAIVGLAAAWAFVSPWLAVILFVVLLILVFLRSVYDKFAAIETDRDSWKTHYEKGWTDDVNKMHAKWTHEMLQDAFDSGITLRNKLSEPSWEALVGEIDQWGLKARDAVKTACTAEELAVYEAGLPFLGVDVQWEHMQAFMQIRLGRLLETMKKERPKIFKQTMRLTKPQ